MRARNISAGFSTLIIVALVCATVVVGRGQPTPTISLGSGTAWFPTIKQGSVALFDGSSGGRVTKVDGS